MYRPAQTIDILFALNWTILNFRWLFLPRRWGEGVAQWKKTSPASLNDWHNFRLYRIILDFRYICEWFLPPVWERGVAQTKNGGINEVQTTDTIFELIWSFLNFHVFSIPHVMHDLEFRNFLHKFWLNWARSKKIISPAPVQM